MQPTQPILLAPPSFTANKTLLEYWKKYFTVITDEEKICSMIPFSQKIGFDTSFFKLPDGRVLNARIAKSVVDKAWEDQKKPPVLQITKEHKEKGIRSLLEMGLPDAPFVPFYARDSIFKGENCHYNSHRSAAWKDFIPAVERLIKSGYTIIRMGEPGLEELPKIDGLFDYANSKYKSDWMDIFLLGCAAMVLTTNSALSTTAGTFGVPVVGTNFSPTPLWTSSINLFIPKLMRDKENRILTFKEMLSPPIIECENGNFFHDNGFSFIDNSPEEILEVTSEMIERLEGKMQYTSEDNTLQNKFKNLAHPEFGEFTSRIGRNFLRKYSELL